jgi:hypothetical protein
LTSPSCKKNSSLHGHENFPQHKFHLGSFFFKIQSKRTILQHDIILISEIGFNAFSKDIPSPAKPLKISVKKEKENSSQRINY